ncbi:MAG TPA: 50S ribosomal protein L4 [Patescibacteria group bacterium]|nr:50S ribosomal protein L4 [Patescibacteria group bacterium]
MNKIEVYTIDANKKADISTPSNFKEKVNLSLLSQAIRVYGDRKHPGLNKTKTRAEVRISTRKIYRQKGTGFARHGAKSAPIFVGGGIAHGPTGLKRILTLSSKMRKKALAMALTLKLESGDIIAVDSLKSFKKTKEVAKFIDKISKKLKKVNKITTFVVDQNPKDHFFLKNIKNATIKSFKNLNAYDVFYGGLILLDKDIFEKGEKITQKKSKTVKPRKVTNK